MAKEINAKLSFEIKLNKRYQISKTQMVKITKAVIWDLFKENKKTDLDIFITDTTGRCYLFSIINRKPAWWNNHYPIVVTCCYSDWELYEKGIIKTDSDYSNLQDIGFTNELFLDFVNEQHSALDYEYSEYDFTKN